ncbi:MAG: cytochrome bc complex cytochrome b subunit [Acidobacteria bacterium]|nr:cytochrome bc complex cytochrome b subunit [Acidobacteriota bacterium]
MLKKITTWLEERLDLSAVRHLTLEKTVPKHRYTPFHLFGGLALFFFMVQVITGILLLMYYKPTTGNAYESVKFIVTRIRFGWLIRSIHSWSANLMILTIFIHMFAKYFLKAYRKPRELTWVSGFILLTLAMAFGFTGYLLPWNELAYFATRVGTESVGATPLIGHWLLELLRGGTDVTGITLSRFFAIHVTVLPLIIIAFLSIHLILVQVQGMSRPIEVKENGKIPFFPDFMLRDLMMWLGALVILVGLATFFPWELGHPVDTFASAPAGIKPEWYFLPMYQILKWMPSSIVGISGELAGIALINIGGIIILLVPFLDRKASRDKKSTWFTIFGILALVFLVAITVYARLY